MVLSITMAVLIVSTAGRDFNTAVNQHERPTLAALGFVSLLWAFVLFALRGLTRSLRSLPERIVRFTPLPA